MDGIRLLPVALLLVCAALFSTACAGEPVADEKPAPAAAPASMTFEALKLRLLKYADSVKQPSDVSASGFAEALMVTFTPNAPGREGGRSEPQVLADGNRFYATFIPSRDPTSIPIHQVFFSTAAIDDLTADIDAPCLWEVDATSRSLKATGYAYNGSEGYRRGGMEFYRRTLSGSRMVFDAKLLTYESSAGGKRRTCVYGMMFSGGA